MGGCERRLALRVAVHLRRHHGAALTHMVCNRNDERLELIERFFRGTGSTYDFMVAAATFGIDDRWKRRIVERIPGGAERILDLACGTGISTLAIAGGDTMRSSGV